MKKFFLLGFSLIFVVSAVASVKHFWRGPTMSQAEVAKRWGESPFVAEKFKAGDMKTKASMASSILKNKKQFLGKDTIELRKELGDPDGFYFRDSFPAYLIHLGDGKKDYAWQIVFLLDNDFKVGEVIVHRNN
nr:hypothetical protein [uncultured bacterium]